MALRCSAVWLLTHVLALVAAGELRAQTTPPPVDTGKTRPDSTKPTMLPGLRSVESRIERVEFDTRPNVGRMSIAGTTLAAAPRFFAEADLLRAVQLLPGVEARNDFNAGLNVRGGEADQNLILLDGYPIYNPFHLAGMFGTFIQPMVGRVDLLTGGFPAPYGGRLSSVLDVRSAEELRKGLHGTAEISLLSTNASVGSSFKEGRGSWMLGGRRTYIDRMVKLLTPQEMPYDFRDLQVHASYAVPNGWRLAATTFAGHDAFTFDPKDHDIPPEDLSEIQVIGWGNRIAGLTVARAFGTVPGMLSRLGTDSLVLEQRVSHSRFDGDINVGDGALVIHAPVRDTRIGGFLAGFSEQHVRTIGYELAAQHFRYESNVAIPILPASQPDGQRLSSGSLYFDDLWRVSPEWMIDAGVRLDAVNASGWWRILPRVSVKHFLTPDFAVTAAVGEYSQWVRSLAREDIPFRPLDFWVGSSSTWPVSLARHYVIGAEGWLNPARGFRVEAFLKTYHNLLEPNPRDDPHVTGDEFQFLRGQSLGADVMLHQFETKHFSGWLAYTFTLNSRTQDDGVRFRPAQDRRHDINLVGNWRHSKYTLSARYNLATGTPYTNIVGNFNRQEYDPITHELGSRGDEEFIVEGRNTRRLPTAQRLDLSLTRNGHLWGMAFSPYLSVVNAGGADNIFAYAFDYSARPPKRLGLPQLPLLPMLGASIAW